MSGKDPTQKLSVPNIAIEEDSLLITSITEYFKLAGVFSAVWLVGYFKLSISWLWLLLVAYIWRELRYKTKFNKFSMYQKLAADEEKVILSRIEDLPSWVNFPDIERVEWLNKIINHMWPYIAEYAEGILREQVEHAIQMSSQELRSFRFSSIDLGDTPPRIGSVKVYSQQKKDEIHMDLELNYNSDCKIGVIAKKMKAGLKDLMLSGTLRLVFKPLINRNPFFGGVLVFFFNNPELSFDLTGLANAFELPGLRHKLHSVLLEQIGVLMVLPNRFPIKLAEGLDFNKFCNPHPQGILRVKVLEAKNLIRADIRIIGRGHSDPYVIIRVGAQIVKTKVIKNTEDPEWNQTFELIVDEADGQLLCLDVMDRDIGTRDDPLGNVSMELSEICNNGFDDVWLPLEDVQHGMLHVQLTWLWLANDPLELDRAIKLNSDVDGAHNAILMVFLDGAGNLPLLKEEENKKGKKVDLCPQATLSVQLQKKNSSIKYNTNDPKWNNNFRFMVHNPYLQNLTIEIKDTQSHKRIGTKIIHLKDLLAAEDMDVDQKFHFLTSKPDSYIKIRLSLRILTPISKPEWMANEEVLMEKDVMELKKRKGTFIDIPFKDIIIDSVKGTKSTASNNPVDTKVSPSEKLISPNESSVDLNSQLESGVDPVLPTGPKKETRLKQIKTFSVSNAGFYGLGRIKLTFRYTLQKDRLIIVVHRCCNLKPLQCSNKDSVDAYVKLKLLPNESTSNKKTKVVKENLNPVFNEAFEYSVSKKIIAKRLLQVIVKDEVGFFSSPDNMLGKVLIDFSTFEFRKPTTQWFDLTPGY